MNLTAPKIVSNYFKDSLRNQPAYPFIEKAIDVALIMVTGSYSFGMSNESSDIDIEFIIPDTLYTALVDMAGGVQHLWVHDENHHPLVDIKIRPFTWLQKRLSGNEPEVLWIYQHAVCIQDPDQLLSKLLIDATKHFHSIILDLLTKRYKDFRAGITIDASREPLGKQIMMTKTIEAALALPFLSQLEPYPYPKWQSIWLRTRHKQGETIVSLCEQWLSGKPMYNTLREEINSVMIEAGYEKLIKHFWRKV